MSLNGVAMDVQGLGRADDVALVDHEPMKEIMTAEVIGKQSLFPKFRQDQETLVPFLFRDAGRDLEGHCGPPANWIRSIY